jgi:hypothetical protein|tara:strand:+ start:480 stop:806 length:327 start_codon:yes stop_codon:yes gene_type:complete
MDWLKEIKVYIIVATVAIIAVVSNPDKDTHKKEIIELITQNVGVDMNQASDLLELLGNAFATGILEVALSNNVYIDNYLLFSLSKLDDTIIGLGAFNNVFLLRDFNEN